MSRDTEAVTCITSVDQSQNKEQYLTNHDSPMQLHFLVVFTCLICAFLVATRFLSQFKKEKKNMAKDTSLTNPGKRKKLTSNVPVHAEEMLETKVKKKKKKMEVEEAPVIPHVTITTSDRKQKKIKKKKQTEEAPVIPHVTITTSDKKQKKKKTKQTETHELEGEEDLSPEEKRVLERKMKKILKKEAKKRLKSEAETVEKSEVSGPIAPQQALDYLTCWAKRRTEWKFQKTRQTWLLQHMFDFAQIPDEKFSVLLQYMEGLQGGAKDTTVKKALALVEESGQAPEDGDLQQRAHRAREVIQLLS